MRQRATSTRGRGRGRGLLALALACVAGSALSLEHGWDCVSCGTNSMLAANFGTWRADFTLADPWWVETVASSYAVVMLNNFWKQGPGSYNGTGTDPKVSPLAANRSADDPLLYTTPCCHVKKGYPNTNGVIMSYRRTGSPLSGSGQTP